MPLTLTQLLISLWFTCGIFFLPVIVYRVVKKEPIKPAMVTYLITCTSLCVGFIVMSLTETLNI